MAKGTFQNGGVVTLRQVMNDLYMTISHIYCTSESSPNELL